ncbi:MAG: murein biosynthesis integral membrane protein MurJ [Chloroflexota bacterium]|nr:murein biosynthesis integral membrane protein MurJ [Chloroflexota bacterium]
MLSNTDITLQEPEAEALELGVETSGFRDAQAQPRRAMGGRIARAALVLMLGTILSRVLGLGRETTIAHLFGGGADVDAFTIANSVATIVYDLLIAGTVSAALVPVFSEYAADPARRPEFGKLVSTILSVAGVFLLFALAVLELLAQPLSNFMCAGKSVETCSQALTMTQWVLPGVFFMGLSGVVMAAHYSLNRFIYPAFTSALFNMAIIFCGFTLAGYLGVRSLVLGIVVGAFAMLAMQLPGLRDIPLRPSFDINHPAVRKILKLYAPVGLSVVVSSAALVIDRNLASQVGEGSISAMRFATTLIQFALGLVSAAISLAALPSLSQHFSNGDDDAYKRTLSAGLRLVTVLVLPAAAGLLALGSPLVDLFFKHGAFTQADQSLTSQALLFYVIGLPFSAIDQVLIFAFYARKNTLTPVLVGIAAAGVYLAVAFGTVGILGVRGLVLGNSMQLLFHAVVMGFLLWRVVGHGGGLKGYGIGDTVAKAGGAAALMAIVSYVTWWALSQVVQPLSLTPKLILLALPLAAGGGIYAVLVWTMRLPEVELIQSKVLGKVLARLHK